MTAKENLQNFVDQYGFGISVRDLADKAYIEMRMDGFEKTYIVNDRYLEVDGITYLFSKSRKHNRWIVKEF